MQPNGVELATCSVEDDGFGVFEFHVYFDMRLLGAREGYDRREIRNYMDLWPDTWYG